jgi:cobalt-precorrin-5B (C1)-methyltransferase
MQVLTLALQAGLPLADAVAEAARSTARKIAAPETAIDVLIFDRQGKLVGRSHG